MDGRGEQQGMEMKWRIWMQVNYPKLINKPSVSRDHSIVLSGRPRWRNKAGAAMAFGEAKGTARWLATGHPPPPQKKGAPKRVSDVYRIGKKIDR